MTTQRTDPSAGHRDFGYLPLFTPEELALLELARRWAPYGGVEEDEVFIKFGITRSQFYKRVGTLHSRATGRVESPTVL